MLKNKYEYIAIGVVAFVIIAICVFLEVCYPYHYYWQEQNALFSDIYTLFGPYYYYKYAGPILQMLSFLVILLILGYVPYIIIRKTGKKVLANVIITAVILSDIYYTYLRSPFNEEYRPYQYGLSHHDFEQTLSVETEYYFGNYRKVIDNAMKADNPNIVMGFYYNLANAQLGLLPDNILKYDPKELGTLWKIGEDTPIAVINMMNDLYYALGDMVYAERAAMMSCVFSPNNKNMKMLKRLAEVNLVSADTLAAMKYLRYLAYTPIYSKWAKEHTPGKMKDGARLSIETKRKYINKQDTLRLGDNCRTILIELLESNPDNELALDYLLCTDLMLKEIGTFKDDYDHYCMQRGNIRLSVLYQQALAIFLAGTEAPKEEWERYISMPDVVQEFRQYNSHRGSEAFKGTYWYYFDKEDNNTKRR
ncbi:MAG: DUF6057 family protein [Bacteroidales bacterium]|nr:DUF6057 family protein [Bacteroidales bacterium]